ncbi:MAG: PAS domain-containing sensor histidine kinase [Pseudomonadota bacterium]
MKIKQLIILIIALSLFFLISISILGYIQTSYIQNRLVKINDHFAPLVKKIGDLSFQQRELNTNVDRFIEFNLLQEGSGAGLKGKERALLNDSLETSSKMIKELKESVSKKFGVAKKWIISRSAIADKKRYSEEIGIIEENLKDLENGYVPYLNKAENIVNQIEWKKEYQTQSTREDMQIEGANIIANLDNIGSGFEKIIEGSINNLEKNERISQKVILGMLVLVVGLYAFIIIYYVLQLFKSIRLAIIKAQQIASGMASVDVHLPCEDETSLILGSVKKIRESLDEIGNNLEICSDQLNGINEASKDAVIILDAERKIQFWSSSAEIMFGRSIDEAKGLVFDSIFPYQQCESIFAADNSGEGDVGGTKILGGTKQLEVARKNGSEFPIELSISAMKIKNRWNSICIVRDISIRKQLESLRDELIRMIIHDLKGPLTGILSSSEILMMPGVDPEKRLKFLKMININSKKLANMIMNLLEIRKMEEKELKLNKEVFRGSDVLEGISWLRDMALSEEKNLKIDIPEKITLYTDKGLLIRVLENLITNAIKHTPSKGDIVVNAKEEDEKILIEVIDTGEGIPKENIQHIFERFFMVKTQTLRSKFDTGLGLSFCKMAIEADGGEINVESEVGKGSRFYFYISNPK